MPNFDIVKKIKAEKSFRVASVMDKFDLQNSRIIETFKGNLDLSRSWQIGIIYGNSGTGKTCIAKELFEENYIINFVYNAKSILDDMPRNKSVDEIVRTFNFVGFSSPPSWLKPYSVLSNGERMRVDLARAILDEKELIVFDEFTSVVDRNVAKIASAAISKAIKRSNKKFIAISCHNDIIEWIEPDWIFCTNNMKFEYTRGRLRRPKIELEIFNEKGKWELFRKYHYLNHEINNASEQFVAYHNDYPCGFCAVLHFPHPKMKNIKRCTRLVVLPDYQGIGIGNKLLEFVANRYIKKFRFRITTSTPALIHSFIKNKVWKLKFKGRRRKISRSKVMSETISKKRFTTSWEYIGEIKCQAK